jgi:hypothetical protein
MDRFSVSQCYNPEITWSSLARNDDPPLKSNPIIRLDDPTNGRSEHLPTPFGLDIRPLAQHLFDEIAGSLQDAADRTKGLR